MSAAHDRKTYIVVHGHFYQPPRENPWTGTIELEQTAAPSHDWNARISDECYTPNTRSRVLDGRGRILDVVNNYRYLSFNFGPTLIGYLEEHCPQTYQRIIQADAQSVKDRGHGNALAQAYNHMIMPLASARDRQTQIHWGLEDFSQRFQRPAEGMWLPETAVNQDTLEDLVRAGMRFVLLAPSQAQAIRPLGEEQWQEVSTGDIPTHRSYLCRTKAGPIQVLFYHAAVSRAVAFEHLLRNAGVYADRLLGAAAEVPQDEGDRLVMVCTDGESYGHHEPMGDMCLAYLVTRELSQRNTILTNPAAFLKTHPPAFEVKIKGGEGTAWSCAHGVGRWKEDCGCSTGGPASWNQGWRAPLRQAMDALRQELDLLFEQEARKYLKDPWRARDEYLQVVLGKPLGASDRFFSRHSRQPLDVEARAQVYRLMEMQRAAMLMYTSCGWFFSDLSGIETVQNLRYSVRAQQLGAWIAGHPVDGAFIKEIQKARSNIATLGTGLDVIERAVMPTMLSPQKVAASFAFLSLAESFSPTKNLFRFRIQAHQKWQERQGELSVSAFLLTVQSEWTCEGGHFMALLVSAGGVRQQAFVRACQPQNESVDLRGILSQLLHEGFEATCSALADTYPSRFGLADMLPDLRMQVVQAVLEPFLVELEEVYQQAFTRHEALLRALALFHISLPPELRLVAGYAGSKRFNRLVERSLEGQEMKAAFEMAGLLESLGVPLERSSSSQRLAQHLKQQLERILQKPVLDEIEQFIRLLQNARAARLDVDEATLQDMMTATLEQMRSPQSAPTAINGSAQDTRKALMELAGYLNLNTDELHKHSSS